MYNCTDGDNVKRYKEPKFSHRTILKIKLVLLITFTLVLMYLGWYASIHIQFLYYKFIGLFR